MTKLTSNLLFVYGTLKKGFPLESNLKDAEYIGEAVTRKANFSIDTHNEAWPAMLLGDYHIKGEVYQINQQIIDRLDVVEGVPHLYERVKIKLKGFKKPVYVYIAGDRLVRLLEKETTSTKIHTDKRTKTQEWIGDVRT